MSKYDSETVSGGSNSEQVPLNGSENKSVQLNEGGSFDGSLDVEVSNDGANWTKVSSGVSGLVEVTETARFGRVVDTSGTTGEYEVLWYRPTK